MMYDSEIGLAVGQEVDCICDPRLLQSEFQSMNSYVSVCTTCSGMEMSE